MVLERGGRKKEGPSRREREGPARWETVGEEDGKEEDWMWKEGHHVREK